MPNSLRVHQVSYHQETVAVGTQRCHARGATPAPTHAHCCMQPCTLIPIPRLATPPATLPGQGALSPGLAAAIHSMQHAAARLTNQRYKQPSHLGPVYCSSDSCTLTTLLLAHQLTTTCRAPALPSTTVDAPHTVARWRTSGAGYGLGLQKLRLVRHTCLCLRKVRLTQRQAR